MPATSSAAARPLSVTTALTLNRPADQPRPKAPARRSRRRRDDVENPDYAAFAGRVIRAHGRRVAEGDVEGLADLLALAAELETATQVAVDGVEAARLFLGRDRRAAGAHSPGRAVAVGTFSGEGKSSRSTIVGEVFEPAEAP